MVMQVDRPRQYQVPQQRPRRIDRRSRRYVQWVQRSLNRLIGAGLAVDGIYGPRTRRAVRQFQQRRGLQVDGIVGAATERALRAAGASAPPGVTTVSRTPATLADLASFSRQFIRRFIATGRRIDCADLAIEMWIHFGEQYGIPVHFQIWDANNRRWLVAKRDGVRVRSTSTLVRRFRTTRDLVRYVQGNLGARGLQGNTHPVAGGHRSAVAGDVFLWEYINNRTNRRHRFGHTQIIDRVHRGSSGPNSDRITIAQGSFPPIVPVIRTFPAAYFYRPRTAILSTPRGREPHTGVLVGTGPRRFNAFRHLR